MARVNPSIPWPPSDGVAFIRSQGFGALLVDIARQFNDRYPRMDFSDAVSQVFAWFDGKLSSNRRFINQRRFPTFSAFHSYVRQSMWNAAQLAQRKRQRREEIEALPIDEHAVLARKISPDELDRLLDLVASLQEPHKTVFERYFLDEDDPIMLASVLGITEDDVHRLYEEAVDMLAR